VLRSFEVSVLSFAKLGEELRGGRDSNGYTHISLAPFFLIFQRQAMAAYDVLSSSSGLPGLGDNTTGCGERPDNGKMGRTIRSNADIWTNRVKDKKTYLKTYQGAALESVSLPRAHEIRTALTEIKRPFLHPNPSYYYRHFEMDRLDNQDYELKLEFFDVQRM